MRGASEIDGAAHTEAFLKEIRETRVIFFETHLMGGPTFHPTSNQFFCVGVTGWVALV